MTSARSGGPLARSVPPPLAVAASLALLEAVVLVAYAIMLVPALRGERLVMGATSVGFFLVYAGFVAFCAWRVYRLQSWARAPLVLSQIIQVLVGASFWGGGTTRLAVALIAVAVLALAGIMHPASIRALTGED